MARHGTAKPVIISYIRSSPTGGSFFALVRALEYNNAISANFVQTVKNSNVSSINHLTTFTHTSSVLFTLWFFVQNFAFTKTGKTYQKTKRISPSLKQKHSSLSNQSNCKRVQSLVKRCIFFRANEISGSPFTSVLRLLFPLLVAIFINTTWKSN